MSYQFTATELQHIQPLDAKLRTKLGKLIRDLDPKNEYPNLRLLACDVANLNCTTNTSSKLTSALSYCSPAPGLLITNAAHNIFESIYGYWGASSTVKQIIYIGMTLFGMNTSSAVFETHDHVRTIKLMQLPYYKILEFLNNIHISFVRQFTPKAKGKNDFNIIVLEKALSIEKQYLSALPKAAKIMLEKTMLQSFAVMMALPYQFPIALLVNTFVSLAVRYYYDPQYALLNSLQNHEHVVKISCEAVIEEFCDSKNCVETSNAYSNYTRDHYLVLRLCLHHLYHYYDEWTFENFCTHIDAKKLDAKRTELIKKLENSIVDKRAHTKFLKSVRPPNPVLQSRSTTLLPATTNAAVPLSRQPKQLTRIDDSYDTDLDSESDDELSSLPGSAKSSSEAGETSDPDSAYGSVQGAASKSTSVSLPTLQEQIRDESRTVIEGLKAIQVPADAYQNLQLQCLHYTHKKISQFKSWQQSTLLQHHHFDASFLQELASSPLELKKSILPKEQTHAIKAIIKRQRLLIKYMVDCLIKQNKTAAAEQISHFFPHFYQKPNLMNFAVFQLAQLAYQKNRYELYSSGVQNIWPLLANDCDVCIITDNMAQAEQELRTIVQTHFPTLWRYAGTKSCPAGNYSNIRFVRCPMADGKIKDLDISLYPSKVHQSIASLAKERYFNICSVITHVLTGWTYIAPKLQQTIANCVVEIDSAGDATMNFATQRYYIKTLWKVLRNKWRLGERFQDYYYNNFQSASNTHVTLNPCFSAIDNSNSWQRRIGIFEFVWEVVPSCGKSITAYEFSEEDKAKIAPMYARLNNPYTHCGYALLLLSLLLSQATPQNVLELLQHPKFGFSKDIIASLVNAYDYLYNEAETNFYEQWFSTTDLEATRNAYQAINGAL